MKRNSVEPWKVQCDVCGWKFHSSLVKKRWDGHIVCPRDYEERHDQDFLRAGRTQKPLPFVRENLDGRVEIPVDANVQVSHFWNPQGIFYRPVVTLGVGYLNATKVTNTSTFGTHTIALKLQAVNPTKYTNTSTFGNHDIGLRLQVLNATKHTNTNTFGTHTLTKIYAASATKFTNTSSFGSHTVTNVFSLTNPAPTGSSYKFTEVPTTSYCYIGAYSSGFIEDQDFTQTAFGSPTGGTNASGIYWKWANNGGDAPNYTNMTENTWYAVSTGKYVGVTGNRTCMINIYFARDGSGTGATGAGAWDLQAEMM